MFRTLNVLANRFATTVTNMRALAGLCIDIQKPKMHVLKNLLSLYFVFVIGSIVMAFVILPNSLIYAAVFAFVGSALFSPLLMLVYLWIRARNRGANVERELRYLLVSESVIASGSPNIVDDLKDIHQWGSVFKTLSREAKIIRALRKFMTTHETVRTYVKWLSSDWVRTTLSDYLFSLSLGSHIHWLQTKGNEIIENLKAETVNKIRVRVTISLIVAILLGYVPPLIVAMTAITGSELIMQAILLTLFSIPIAFLVTPKLPLHISVNYEAKHRLAVIIATIIANVLLFFLGIDLAIITYVAGILLLILGIDGVRDHLSGLLEAKELASLLNVVAEAPLTLANPLSILRKVMNNSSSKVLRDLATELNTYEPPKSACRLKLWLSRFSIYTIMRGLRYGALNRESVIKLRELVIETLKELKTALATNVVIVGMAIALPIIMGSLMSFTEETQLTAIYMIVASLTYSAYTSYVVFNDLTNTLIPGIVLIELGIWVL